TPDRHHQRARLPRPKPLVDVPLRGKKQADRPAPAPPRRPLPILPPRRPRETETASYRFRAHLGLVLATPRRVLRGALPLPGGWDERVDAGRVKGQGRVNCRGSSVEGKNVRQRNSLRSCVFNLNIRHGFGVTGRHGAGAWGERFAPRSGTAARLA